MPAFFVTATGTDIGKTFIASGLIRHLRLRGVASHAVKPVISGFDDEDPAASDSGVLLAAIGRSATLDEVARISPWRFKTPLSPDMAARRGGRTLDFAALVKFSQEAIDSSPNVLLIEGVGGVMAPLNERKTMIDWMAALDLPILLVAGSYLGAISHTLSALDALNRRTLKTRAVIVSESAESPVDLGETVESIARFAAPVAVTGMPRLSQPTADHPAFYRLAELIMGPS